MVNDNELIEVFERFNNDVVVKPNFGSSGVNVERATDKDEFIKIVNKLMSQYSAIAVSPYYSYENEYRLIMLDGGCETSFLKQRTNSWKHNLAQGAIPKDISDTKLLSKLVEIAVKTCKALGIRFCSVDIAQIGQDIFKVVEVNSGVMMESFAKVDEEHYQQVKRIYSKALER
jgi:glutathione synthase/RimK-type ligase-like ATP-grasp enzyme